MLPATWDESCAAAKGYCWAAIKSPGYSVSFDSKIAGFFVFPTAHYFRPARKIIEIILCVLRPCGTDTSASPATAPSMPLQQRAGRPEDTQLSISKTVRRAGFPSR